MSVRPGVNDGMSKKDNPELKPINYILIENIDDYIQKIKTFGDTITQPKQEIPEIGWIIHCTDPEGNPFAIMESIR